MKTMNSRYENLANRSGFNASVRHIKSVLAIIDGVVEKENLADLTTELLLEKTIQAEALTALASMVLVEKFGYQCVALNLPSVNENLKEICTELVKWNGVDLVVLYHHPELGSILVNPKNEKQLARIDRLTKYELIDVYAGAFGKKADKDTLEKAADAVSKIFAGKSVKALPAFLKGDCVYKAPKGNPVKISSKVSATSTKPGKSSGKAAPAVKRGKAAKLSPEVVVKPQKAAAAAEAAAASPVQNAGRRMTPMYNVAVTNELFHNGNVEAWKKIIESYCARHTDCEVIVYYDRERITNLNALFKWGKVKRGTSIQFAVVGESISDLAKLVRYLAQGASSMYEAFLKGPVNSVLPLF